MELTALRGENDLLLIRYWVLIVTMGRVGEESAHREEPTAIFQPFGDENNLGERAAALVCVVTPLVLPSRE
jgi:hypothetical protein